MKVLIYTDGGSRGNPGPAACGAVVKAADDGQTLIEEGRFLGRATNNVAEYHGVLLGLELAGRLEATEIELCSDSELLVRQLSGVYRVKSPRLKDLYAEVREALGPFEHVDIRHVRREKNTEADRLVNETLDAEKKADSQRDDKGSRGGAFRLK